MNIVSTVGRRSAMPCAGVLILLLFAPFLWAFEPSIHERMTEEELRALGFDVDSADEVGDSNYWTDIFESSNEAAHADNNKLGDASGRLADYRVQVGEALAACRRRNALDRFGEALHTVQDVYSHSNSVDNGIAIPDLLGMVDGTAQCAPPAFAPTGLVTGYFSVSGWFIGNQCRGMPQGWCCHRELNKDSPSKPNGARHPAAVTAARGATRTYYDLVEHYIRARFPAQAEQMLGRFKRKQRSTFFVIDDTGSMGTDLAGVKSTVNTFLDQLVANGEAATLGLVTFKDNVSNHGVVCDIELLRSKVNALFASGGGDCPEASNSALMAALSQFPGATTDMQAMGGRILLATDASAGDAHLGSYVRSEALVRRVSIDAILTGDCVAETSTASVNLDGQDSEAASRAMSLPAPEAIDPINSPSARTQLRALTEQTGGVLFNVRRGEVRDVSAVLLELNRPDVAILLSRRVSAASGVVEVPLDDTLTGSATFMVTASTAAAVPNFVLRRPDGTAVMAGDPGVEMRRLSSVVSYEIASPEPGVWQVEFSDGAGVLRAYAASSLRLNSVRLLGEGDSALDHAEELEPIENDPVIGALLAARLRFTERPAEVAVRLLTPEGALLQSAATPERQYERMFLAELEIPAVPFVIEASGLTDAGFRFVRQVAVPVIPQPLDLGFVPRQSIVAAGATAVLDLEIDNRGSTLARYRLNAVAPVWPVSVPSLVEVAAGTRATVRVEVTVPAEAAENALSFINVVAEDQQRIGVRNRARATLIVGETNQPPECGAAYASPALLWPVSHRMHAITIDGVVDADDDPLQFEVLAITQDEPVRGPGAGNTSPDGSGVGESLASVRAERDGHGDGRVYRIGFAADDGRGGRCEGAVEVAVPHSDATPAIDSGQHYDSTEG
jgi:von Willebrand factor A domain-containing protein 7